MRMPNSSTLPSLIAEGETKPAIANGSDEPATMDRKKKNGLVRGPDLDYMIPGPFRNESKRTGSYKYGPIRTGPIRLTPLKVCGP